MGSAVVNRPWPLQALPRAALILLKELLATAGKEETPEKRLHVSNRELASLAGYFTALKLLRAGKWVEAGKGLRAAAKVPEGKITYLLKEVNNNALERAKFCAAAAELAKNADGDKLYRLASLIYKKRNVFTAGFHEWTTSRSPYATSTGPAGYFLSRSRFWQAERIYRKVVKDHPKSKSRAKAIYMLGCCYCHLAEHDSAFWVPRQKAYVKESVIWFRMLAKEYPKHELVPDARKAADHLVKAWDIQE